MKETEIDQSAIERSIIIGMITSTKYLKLIYPIYNLKYFQTEFTKTIAEWCWEYYKQYDSSPGVHIQDIFKSKEDELEESEIEIISLFLSSISNEYERSEQFNVEYMVKQTENYFESYNQNELGAKILSHTSTGRIEEVKNFIREYKSVCVPSSDGFNPFNDAEAIKRTFEKHSDPLFTFPGAFGSFINSQLTRDSFIAIMSPPKRGKTWWLDEFAFRATKNKLNVALFQLGDLSEDQQRMRFLIRLAGKSNKEQYCGTILKPILDCKLNQDDSCNKKQRYSKSGGVDWKDFEKNKKSISDFIEDYEDHEPCDHCSDSFYFKGAIWYEKKKIGTPLDWKEAFKLGMKFNRKYGDKLKISCHPRGALSVSGSEGILDRWRDQDGFIADVILYDYADYLSPEPGDNRKQIWEYQYNTWGELRALSIKWNALVITATQTDGTSYEEESLKPGNYTGCRGKYDHVTGIFGLNQTPLEKRKGICRFSKMFIREDEFDIEKEINIIQCLSMGRPFISSYF